jgi:WD40 repeat protein
VTSDPFVFVSYSRDDRDYVDGLVAYLAEQGITAWIDRERITNGERWAPLIEQQIEACAAMIVVMSPTAKKSEWVQREIALAEMRGKPILPLLLAGEQLFPVLNLHYDDVRDGRIPPPRFIEQLRAITGLPALDPEPEPGRPTTPVSPRKLAGPRRSVEPLPARISLRAPVITGYREVTATAIAPDGTWFATAGADRHVRLWDAETGELLSTLRQHPAPIDEVRIVNDGHHLITASHDGLRWWDSSAVLAPPLRVLPGPLDLDGRGLEAGGSAKLPRSGSTKAVVPSSISTALSPDGTWLAALQHDRIFRVDTRVDGRDTEVLIRLAAPPPGAGEFHAFGPMAMSPDGSWLAVGNGFGYFGRLTVPESGQARHTQLPWSRYEHQSFTHDLAWAPSGSWLVTARTRHLQNEITLWSASDLTRIGTVGNTDSGGRAVAISPREDWFMVGSNNGLTIWRVATREALVQLASTQVNHLSLSPDTTWCVAGTSDGILLCNIQYA